MECKKCKSNNISWTFCNDCGYEHLNKKDLIMAPKEKAEELVQKFYLTDYMGGYGMVPDCYKESAIGCALITVDEIISSLRKDLPEIGLGKGYWASVRNELNKMRS